jgi:myo-inositol-1(or 4)-monophosphatase
MKTTVFDPGAKDGRVSMAMKGVAYEAGRLLRSMQSTGLDRDMKGSHDFSTAADLASQRLIREKLSSVFPDVAIVAEEDDEHVLKQTCFIVDPLDATYNYSVGGSDWGVVIGLLTYGNPVRAVLYQPNADLIVEVAQGGGVLMNGVPCVPPLERPLKESIIGTEIVWSNPEGFIDHVIKPLQKQCLGLVCPLSASAGVVKLLRGEIAAYVNLTHGKVWDFVVHALAMEEWGGVALAPNGMPLQWDSLPMRGVFSPHQKLAEALLTLTRRVEQ